MVVAGFTTSTIGYLLYLAICVLTGGIGYLVFRWVPRWRISIVGSPTPLKKCSWVVVEVSSGPERRYSKKKAKRLQNQWGEFTVHYITVEEYGYPMSSVFTAPKKEKNVNGYNTDHDPEMPYLRFLDYRYMRLIYHPKQDRFVLNNDWWDPQWDSVKALREGLDAEERDPRDQVFGKNVIEIQQKTIPQLLLDEVCELYILDAPLADMCRRFIPSTSFKSLV
jgi:cation-transporting ATPase 13A3/4/5